MSINFDIWIREYEKEYKTPIVYRDDCTGKRKEERSPRFETISRTIQKRGYLLKDEFLSICEWKTKRQKNRYRKNSSPKIKQITKEVISLYPKTKEQIHKLTQLDGVGIPVASAILTVIFPNDYCVLDYRAWRALLWIISNPSKFKNYSEFSKVMDKFKNYTSLKSYDYYLEQIRSLSKKYHKTTREIEMALWMYDKKGGKL